jgi:hypothetical protein
MAGKREYDDNSPSLGAQAVMRAIRELPAVQRLVGAEVKYKKNAEGKHVIAIIFPSQPS